MVERPVFVPRQEGPPFVEIHYLLFEWAPGFAISQKQKSIGSLHREARKILKVSNPLEISSKSQKKLGVALSSFNLTFSTVKYGRELTVEAAYQGSKVFERGGPYFDLYERPAKEAK